MEWAEQREDELSLANTASSTPLQHSLQIVLNHDPYEAAVGKDEPQAERLRRQ